MFVPHSQSVQTGQEKVKSATDAMVETLGNARVLIDNDHGIDSQAEGASNPVARFSVNGKG